MLRRSPWVVGLCCIGRCPCRRATVVGCSDRVLVRYPQVPRSSNDNEQTSCRDSASVFPRATTRFAVGAFFLRVRFVRDTLTPQLTGSHHVRSKLVQLAVFRLLLSPR
jgi:hypothetical protein